MDSKRNDQPASGTGAEQADDHVYGQTPGAGDWKRIARIVLLVALVLWTVLFFASNRETTTVSLVVTSIEIPLIWVLIGTFLAGMIVMYLLTYLRGRKRRKAAKKS